MHRRFEVFLLALVAGLIALLSARRHHDGEKRHNDRHLDHKHQEGAERIRRASPPFAFGDVGQKLEAYGTGERRQSELPPIDDDALAELFRELAAPMQSIDKAIRRTNDAASKEVWPLRFYQASAILLLVVTAVSLWFNNLTGGVSGEAAARQADAAETAERPGVALESATIVRDGDHERVSIRLHNYGGGPASTVTLRSLGMATPASEGSCQGRSRHFDPAAPRHGATIWPGQTIEVIERLSPSSLVRNTPGFLVAVVEYGSAIERLWHCEAVFLPLGSDPFQDAARELKPDATRSIGD